MYSPGTRGGLFGAGFSLGLPTISRETDQGIPRYDDSDLFLGPGGQELTPGLISVSGNWQPETFTATLDGSPYTVRIFRSRVNPSESRIERWTAPDGTCFWQVRDAHNGLSVFGRSPSARIADPQFPGRVCQWLIESESDAVGNRITYSYRAEDGAGWTGWTPPGGFAARYIDRIAFGNYRPAEGASESDGFELLFDYGDHDLSGPTPVAAGPWPMRADPIFDCRPGFVLQCLRLCRNVVVLNHLPPGRDSAPLITRILAFGYDEDPILTRLSSATLTGFRQDGKARTSTSLPPMTYTYVQADPRQATWQPMLLSDGSPVPIVDAVGHTLMIDLYGEGLPGILDADHQSLRYFPPLGNGVYGSAQPLPQFPDAPGSAPPSYGLSDLEGNGHQSLVVYTPQLGGYFYNRNDGTWDSFRPFASYPLEATNPQAEWADVDGDGRAELLIQDPTSLMAFPSLGFRGFGPPTVTALQANFPWPEGGDERQMVSYANVLGDGLSHRVSVSDGRVEVWPCLGYGRFAPSFVMTGSPRLGELLPDRILWGGFCGTTRSDLLLLHPDHLELYPNLGGIGFGAPILLPLPGGLDPLDRVLIADVAGLGRAALVIIQATAPQQARFLDFGRGGFPYFLATAATGMGAITAFSTMSSTEAYLQARGQGTPWLTTLANPVPIVSELVDTDTVTGLVSTNTYTYRDGYYDPVDREFRGFGYIQTINTEVAAPATGSPPATEARLIRTWYHVGAFGEQAALLASDRSQYFQAGPQAPKAGPLVFTSQVLASSPETVRQAAVALAGSELHSETYALGPDGTPATVPLIVEDHNYTVDLLQPALSGQYASFLALPRESLELTYEADSNDPRVTHDATLAWDEYGHVTQLCSVFYPRRRPLFPAQGELRSILYEMDYVLTDTPEVYLVAPVWQTRQSEVAGIVPSEGSSFTYDDLAKQVATATSAGHRLPYGSTFSGGPQTRLFAWNQATFWDDTLQQPAPQGQSGLQGLVHHDREAIFPVTFPERVFGNRVTPTMLGQEAGYASDQGYWWRSGNTVYYDPAGYGQPTAFVDPYQTRSACTVLTYDQPYGFEPVRCTDALGHTITLQMDYQAMEPSSITDENGVIKEALYDGLGSLVVLSQHGLIQGQYRGSMLLTHYQPQAVPSLSALLANPGAYLQGAFSYYQQQFAGAAGQPPWMLAIHSRAYGDSPTASLATLEPEISITYLDGFGRTCNEIRRIEGSTTGAAQPGSWAWVSQHRVDYDERGQVVRSYLPAFVSSSAPEPPGDRPYSLHTYDALDRETRVDLPKGFFARTERPNPWLVRQYDADDTVTQSTYYQTHINDPALPPAEKQALLMAATFADTPVDEHFDAQGFVARRDTINVDSQGQRQTLSTFFTVDIRGLLVAIEDPRSITAFTATYDMPGRQLLVTRSDAGQAMFLPDATDEKLHRWTALGVHIQVAYDSPLRRPLQEYVDFGQGPQTAVTYAYGTDPGTLSVNRMVQTNDQGGTVTIPCYYLDGRPWQATRRFAQPVEGLIDWSGTVSMLPDTWAQSWDRDPAGDLLAETCADGTVIQRSLYANGWIAGIAVQAPGAVTPQSVVSDLAYTPSGQPASAQYGQGLAVAWDYDPLTLERIHDQVLATSTGQVLQDLTYTLDPVGNLCAVADLSGVLSPAPPRQTTYSFDALYRQLEARGWTLGTGTSWAAYHQSYRYDDGGNLTALNQPSGPTTFQRPFAVSTTSNRAVPSSLLSGGKTLDSYFDAAGNLLSLDGSSSLTYDYDDRLATVIPPTGITPNDWYRYDANGLRTRRRTTDPALGTIDTFTLGPAFIQDVGAVRTSYVRVRAYGDDILMLSHTTGGPPQVQYFCTDRVGSVTLTVSGDGTPQTLSSYSPYGEASASAANNSLGGLDLGFAGQERDAETGLSYFGARYYNPGWGRWLTPDPLGESGGLNLYAYVADNPVSGTDRLGNMPKFTGFGDSDFGSVLGNAAANTNYGRKSIGLTRAGKLRRRLGRTSGGYVRTRTTKRWRFVTSVWIPDPTNTGVGISRAYPITNKDYRQSASVAFITRRVIQSMFKTHAGLVSFVRGHRIPHADTATTTPRAGGVLSTQFAGNYYPEPEGWGEQQRAHREAKARGRSVPVVQVEQYSHTPTLTLNGTPVPERLWFIEFTALGESSYADSKKSYTVKAYEVNYRTFDYDKLPKVSPSSDRRRTKPLRVYSLPPDVLTSALAQAQFTGTEYPLKWK